MDAAGVCKRASCGPGRGRAANVATIAIALGLAWGLKAFYSRATFEDLLWILSPTRRLVEWWTGTRFAPEPGQGFLSRSLMYQIVPACAGVNFMIVAFTSLVCGLIHTCSTWVARLQLLVASASAAYVATSLANATRIAIAMRLHESAASFGPFTPGRLHCAEGVAVYLVFLCALFAVGACLTGAQRDFSL